MAIEIFRRQDQADGQFNGGAIMEKKPIGFPQDGGILRPYSNLFYWAHAWSDSGSTIGEHPHQGFEIMSFVLKGRIEHYDSKLKGWKPLEAGDVQIIRSGSGITHAERLHAGSSIFQIWVDPDITRTLNAEASYNDYPSLDFKVEEGDGFSRKVFSRLGEPISMMTEDLVIYQLSIHAGEIVQDLSSGTILSAFVLEGEADVDGKPVGEGDFIIAREQEKLSLLKQSPVLSIFIIESPLRPSYTTYAEKFLR